jgi:predicted nucleic acid-binding protein
MVIFVDTSALYALASKKDASHRLAVDTWEDLTEQGEQLLINNYVHVESIALLQNRLGLESVNYLQSEIVPFLSIKWVDEEQHAEAIQNVLSADRRDLSLVDCASFGTMYRLDIDTIFTFDAHFSEQGFNMIP